MGMHRFPTPEKFSMKETKGTEDKVQECERQNIASH